MEKEREGENEMILEKEKLLTVNEVAEFFGVTRRTVNKWIDDGKLPAFRLGKVFRVKEDDFKKFFNEHFSK